MAKHPPRFGSSIKAALWEECYGRCSYCGKHMNPFTDFTVDHVEPRALGGSNEYINLRACCKTCNSIKRERPEDYLRDALGIEEFWCESDEFFALCDANGYMAGPFSMKANQDYLRSIGPLIPQEPDNIIPFRRTA